MSNIKFVYLYRDGANYKSWGEVVCPNPDQLTLDEIENRLVDAFLPDKLFIAHQISIPEKFLFVSGKFAKFDHCYHEFDAVEICEEKPTDNLFIQQIGQELYQPASLLLFIGQVTDADSSIT